MPTVLIIDDNEESLYFLRCVLVADGYSLLEAKNGIEALELAKQHRIDIVVSDVLMPGMDGFSLCRVWCSHPEFKSIPIVFYTATYTDARDGEFALSLGAADFIVKPMEPALLRERIRKVLHMDRSTITATAVNPMDEAPYLQQYNAVLIRKLEDKLADLERTNRVLMLKEFALSSSVSGVLFGDVAGRVTYFNPAMARLCSDAVVDLDACTIGAILTLPDGWSEWLAHGEGGLKFESRLRSGPNLARESWLLVSAHRIVSGDGQFLGVMISCLDLTEERRLRAQLERVQRLEALSLFAAGVAHDFNNLLMGVYAGLELDSLADTSSSDRREFRAMALAACERAQDLTKRLLTFSRNDISPKKVTDVRQLLDEATALTLSGSAVRCVKTYTSTAAFVYADAGQLAQVFGNLLLNARQAMEGQGTVAISVQRTNARESTHPLADSGAQIIVRIPDTGPGISSDVVHRIFEPYFTTKADGTGLGLATSHAIVHQHAGSLEVVSQPGCGATFELRLPATSDEPERAIDFVRSTAPQGSGRVLVMDDQVVIQALLQRVLERAGYSVEVTSNGEQAILEFHRAERDGVPFGLLILDATVRGAMGGTETLSTLRGEGHDVAAIAATGYCDDSSMARLKQAGFNRILAKPFLTHELLSVVKAVFVQGPLPAAGLPASPTIR